MPRLSPAELAALLDQAGFDRDELVTGVAIALAESGGDPGGHRVVTRDQVDSVPGQTGPEDSRGLWQINVDAHPWGRSIDLYNPTVNARAARRVYQEAGGSWRPWSTFKLSDHRDHLDDARAGVATHLKGSPSAGPTPGAGFDAVLDDAEDDKERAKREAAEDGGGGLADRLASALGSAFGAAVDQAVPDRPTWLRIGQGVAGAALVGAGAVLLLRDVGGDLAGQFVGDALGGTP